MTFSRSLSGGPFRVCTSGASFALVRAPLFSSAIRSFRRSSSLILPGLGWPGATGPGFVFGCAHVLTGNKATQVIVRVTARAAAAFNPLLRRDFKTIDALLAGCG